MELTKNDKLFKESILTNRTSSAIYIYTVITCGCPIEYKEKGKSNPRNRKIKQKKEFLNKFLASENIKIEFRKIEEKAIKVMYP